jgi:hypothetical protein
MGTGYLLVRNDAASDDDHPDVLALPAAGLAERLRDAVAVAATAHHQDHGQYHTSIDLVLPPAEGAFAEEGDLWAQVFGDGALMVAEFDEPLADDPDLTIDDEVLVVDASGQVCFRYALHQNAGWGQSAWLQPEAIYAALDEAGLGLPEARREADTAAEMASGPHPVPAARTPMPGAST